MARLGIYQTLERFLIKSFVYICKGLVLVHRHFLKPRNDGKNRPSGQFFPSSPRYAGDEKPSLLSHDVLPSPALLDFLREQALSKTPQSGGSLSFSAESTLLTTIVNIYLLTFEILTLENSFRTKRKKVWRKNCRNLSETAELPKMEI